ncbi:uncharacterized protein LOC142375667 [Odontesthes bonariensis]|uniref:uncharacterized protein LOC142375667 n=1 Tax=Odontesthes bonariensis TaxID=219752 RepID=UPI003F58B638
MKYLCISKLNQDCIENLFSLIRGKGGHKYNPSAREFTATLRGLSVSNILPALSSSGTSNCEVDDGTTLLATVSDDTIPSTTAPPTSLAPGEVEAGEQMVVSDIVEDKTVGDCLQEEGLHYVAGWVIRVLQQEEVVQACPQCEVVLMGARDQDHSYAAASTNHPFLEAKKFTSTANLMKPSDNFFAAIQLLEGEFVRLINDFWPHKGITKKLESALFKLGAFNSLFRAHQEHARGMLEAIAIKKFGAEIRERNRRLLKPQGAIAAQRKLSSFMA